MYATCFTDASGPSTYAYAYVTTSASHSSDFGAIAADGTAVSGLLFVGAKNGTLGHGDGAYLPGNSCVFGGNIRSS